MKQCKSIFLLPALNSIAREIEKKFRSYKNTHNSGDLVVE